MKHSLKRIVAMMLCLSTLFSIAAFAIVENEDNGNIASADVLKMNSSAIGNISDWGDYDYYKITLPTDMAIQFTLRHELELNDPTSSYYSIHLYDSNGWSMAGIDRQEITGAKTEWKSPVYGLRAGTYYVWLEAANRLPTSDYILTVNSLNVPAEKEPNGYAVLGTALTSGKAVTGALTGSYDEDFYTFTLATDGAFSVNFTQDMKISDPTSGYYTIQLCNGDGTDYYVAGDNLTWYIRGQDTNWTSPTVGLRAGTYALKVTASTYSSDSYTIKYTEENVVAEAEGNNYAVLATPLTEKIACTGTLVTYSDDDWYSFSVTSDSAVSIFFNQPLKTKDSTWSYYKIYLFDEAGENQLQSWEIAGQTTNWFSGPLNLDIGNYRILVTCGYNHSDQNYKIKVLAQTSLAFTIDSLEYEVNGTPKMTDVAPYIKAGRTYLPMRVVGESMNAQVAWNAADRTVTITKGDVKVVLTIDSKIYTVNGVAKTADVAPEIVDGRTCLPIRFVVEALGGVLGWDAYTRVVTITY